MCGYKLKSFLKVILQIIEKLPVKRTVKDAIELLRNCDLGQMVRYAATI